MTYESMTAKELHDIVTRLEARGFKVPRGIAYSYGIWDINKVPNDTPFAAAIIEVAARDWWIRARLEGDKRAVEVRSLDASCWHNHKEIGWGPTPLHAILAAVEAR